MRNQKKWSKQNCPEMKIKKKRRTKLFRNNDQEEKENKIVQK